MKANRPLSRVAPRALAIAALTGCTPIVDSHGFVPPDAVLDEIEVGVDTESTVESIVGRPSSTGFLNELGWFYVKSEYTQRAWFEPRETGREVVAITFDDGGVVSNVERFGIEDGQIVALSRRVTDAPTEGIGFFQQLFGNLGNFNPGAFLNNE